MQRLTGFTLVIYDTNCLVYYCFYVDIPESNPSVTVTALLTQHTRSLTEALIANQQKVTTTQAAYAELQECIYDAVESRMTDRQVEAQLGYAQHEKVPSQLKLHVQLSVERKVRKLENKSWFILDREFSPDSAAVALLQQFFNSQNPSSFGRSHKPTKVDMGLINFGLERQLPLVTNDRGISNFASQLATAGLGFKIYNLTDLTTP